MDGSCFFDALLHQLLRHNSIAADAGLHINQQIMRQDIADFMKNNDDLKAHISERLTDQNIDQYVLSILHPTTWADENVLTASSLLYNVTICIFRSGEVVPSTCIGDSSSSMSHRKVYLGYVACIVGEQPTHYVSLIIQVRVSVERNLCNLVLYKCKRQK